MYILNQLTAHMKCLALDNLALVTLDQVLTGSKCSIG
jgi:hypothetical protein